MAKTTSTALALILALTAAPLMAQTTTEEAPKTEEAAPADAATGAEYPTGQEVSAPADGPGSTYTAGTFEAWEQKCVRTEGGIDPCQLYLLLKDKTDNAVAEFTMFNLPKGSEGPAVAGATFVAPLETLLPAGMTLQIDPARPGMTALQSRTLIAPVELPCPDGVDGPLCDRDAALADVAKRFGPGAPFIANGLHLGCHSTPEQVAATFDGQRGSTTCDFRMRQGGEVIGMLGHMHEIGSSYRMTLAPDTDREQVLLDIPVWNFAWQLAYAPVEELRIERGDVVRVTCTWDRGQRHDDVPAWIVFAEGTQDEMCYTSLTVRPDA